MVWPKKCLMSPYVAKYWGILVFYGYCNKLPQTWWLETTEIYSLSFGGHKSAGLHCVLSRVRLFATLWAIGRQALLSLGFSRREYWRGVPFPPPGDLPNPGIERTSLISPALQVGSLPLAPPGKS